MTEPIVPILMFLGGKEAVASCRSCLIPDLYRKPCFPHTDS